MPRRGPAMRIPETISTPPRCIAHRSRHRQDQAALTSITGTMRGTGMRSIRQSSLDLQSRRTHGEEPDAPGPQRLSVDCSNAGPTSHQVRQRRAVRPSGCLHRALIRRPAGRSTIPAKVPAVGKTVTLLSFAVGRQGLAVGVLQFERRDCSTFPAIDNMCGTLTGESEALDRGPAVARRRHRQA